MNKKTVYHFFSGDYENPTKFLEVDVTDLSFNELTKICNEHLEEYEDCYCLVYEDDKLKDAFC